MLSFWVEADDSLKVCLVTIVLATMISISKVGLVNVVGAVIGRIQLSYLSRQAISDDSKEDATVSGIFIYPGTKNAAVICCMN